MQSDTPEDAILKDLTELLEFLCVKNLKEAKQSITGLRERILFTRTFEDLRNELSTYVRGGMSTGSLDGHSISWRSRALLAEAEVDRVTGLNALLIAGAK